MFEEGWVTTEEASEISGYHVNYLRRLIRRGKIQAQKISVVWLINYQSLLDYMAESKRSTDKRRGPKN